MRCEDGGYIDPPFLRQWQGYTSKPLMEMRNDRFFGLVGNKLDRHEPSAVGVALGVYLAQKPSHKVSKYYGFICFIITRWRGYASGIP